MGSTDGDEGGHAEKGRDAERENEAECQAPGRQERAASRTDGKGKQCRPVRDDLQDQTFFKFEHRCLISFS